MSFAHLFRESVNTYPSRIAVTDGGVHQTYAKTFERASRLANVLIGMGLEPGDRVATLADNCLVSLEIVCGLALAGLVRCPMYTQNPPHVHVGMMKDVTAKALIVQETYYAELREHLHSAPSVTHTLVHGTDAVTDAFRYEDCLCGQSIDDPKVEVDENDPYIIRFSAGTTGRSKGIVHTSSGWAAMGREFAAVLPPFESNDSYLVAGPLSHAAGLLSWPLIESGARHVIMPKFDAGLFARTVEAERCTLTLLVPTMIQMILSHPETPVRDMTSLRAVFYGAAPISERTLEDAVRLWGNVLYQLYGQSEAPALTALPPSLHDIDGGRAYLRSAGRPTPNTKIEIMDEAGQKLSRGEVGEICALTPGVMLGIWDNPEATKERFTADGYLRTRDMGYLDEDGFLFLADRKEDLIISGGYNVWPAEVENALCSHPAVLEAAVVGIPDEKWGETVLAVVRLRERHYASASELIAWCRERIGSVKKPTRVEFSVEPLPKSGVGKLMRRALRDQYWKGTSRAIHGA